MKIASYLLLALVFSILLSCQKQEFEPLIKDDILLKAVVDLQIAEEALKKSNKFEKDSLIIVYKDQIVKHHKIKLADLERDLLEMKKHPDYFKDFYDKVISQLEDLEKSGKEDKQEMMKDGKK